MSNAFPFNVDVRLYTSAGVRKDFNPDQLLKVEWVMQEAGGLARVDVIYKGQYEDPPAVVSDLLEVWVIGESVPRCRGIVGAPQAILDLKESHQIVAFGRMADMAKVLDDIIIPEWQGADLAFYAGVFADDYQARRPNLKLSRDFQTTGVLLQNVNASDSSIRKVFDSLFTSGSQSIVWGFDIDPTNGNDRLYVRPRDPNTVGSQYFVGSNVKLIQGAIETQDLANAVKIIGGTATYPQLNYNAGFEVPTVPSSNSGSLIADAGFEDVPGGWANYSASGQAIINTQFSGLTGHTGLRFCMFRSVNDYAYTSPEPGVSPNVQYNLSWYARLGSADRPFTGECYVEGLNSSGAVVQTLPSSPFQFAPSSTVWTGGMPSTPLAGDGLGFSFKFTNTAVTNARVWFKCISADTTGGLDFYGLLIDDVLLVTDGATGQDGYVLDTKVDGSGATSAVGNVQWACRQAAYEGAYGVRVNITAAGSGNTVMLGNTPGNATSGGSQHHWTPSLGQQYYIYAMVRMSPGVNAASGYGSGIVAAKYREWKSGKPQNSWDGTAVTIPDDGNWHVAAVIATANDGDQATGWIEFSAPGYYDVDCLSARAAAAGGNPLSVDTGLPIAQFLRTSTFEQYVKATDVCTAGTPAYESESTYGLFETNLNNTDIIDWNSLVESYMVAYFSTYALPVQRPGVQIYHEKAQTTNPGDANIVRVSGLRSGNDINLYCSKATYTWEGQTLGIRLELNSERPAFAKMLSAISAGGTGSTALSSAVAAAAASSTTSSSSTSLATASTPGGVQPDNDTTVVNGSGVISARVPGVVNGSQVGIERSVNLIAGTGVTITGVGNPSLARTDVTISSEGALEVTDGTNVVTNVTEIMAGTGLSVAAGTSGEAIINGVLATESAAGSMSAADKTKVDGIAAPGLGTLAYDATSGFEHDALLVYDGIAANFYADTNALFRDWPVGLLATSQVTLSGVQTVDGQSTVGRVVGCVGQTNPAQNGPWFANTTGAWTRPRYYKSGATINFQPIMKVLAGSTCAGQQWLCGTSPVVVDTTAASWTLWGASGGGGSIPYDSTSSPAQGSALLYDGVANEYYADIYTENRVYACELVCTVNVNPASPPTVVDGVTISGQQVLLVAQTNPAQNGPWIAPTGSAWFRPRYWKSGSTIVLNTTFMIFNGATGAQTIWTLGAGGITVDTSAATFTQWTLGSTDSPGTASVTSSFLAPGAKDTSQSLSVGRTAVIESVTLSAPACVRIYATTADQAADLNRSVGTPTPLCNGPLEETIGATGNLGPFRRIANVGNLDATIVSKLYVTIINLSSTSQNITATFTFTPIAQ